MSNEPEPITIENAHYYVIQRRWSTKGENGWTDSSSNYWGEDGLCAALTTQADMAKTYGLDNVKMMRRDTLTTEVEITTDVHTSHCCTRHGCKYDEDKTCTVVAGFRSQEFPCEGCDFELNEDGGLEVAYLLNEMYDKGAKKVGTCESCQAPIGDVCSFCA